MCVCVCVCVCVCDQALFATSENLEFGKVNFSTVDFLDKKNSSKNI